MAQQTLDPYALLELGPGASPEEIARAHRRLAKRYHPDVNRRVEATEQMQRINEARRILANPVLRARWERAYPRNAAPGGGYRTAARADTWPPRAGADTWPPRAGAAPTWSTAGGPGEVYGQPWASWQPGDRPERRRRATASFSEPDAFGAAGCAVLLVALALLSLLIRVALY